MNDRRGIRAKLVRTGDSLAVGGSFKLVTQVKTFSTGIRFIHGRPTDYTEVDSPESMVRIQERAGDVEDHDAAATRPEIVYRSESQLKSKPKVKSNNGWFK